MLRWMDGADATRLQTGIRGWCIITRTRGANAAAAVPRTTSAAQKDGRGRPLRGEHLASERHRPHRPSSQLRNAAVAAGVRGQPLVGCDVEGAGKHAPRHPLGRRRDADAAFGRAPSQKEHMKSAGEVTHADVMTRDDGKSKGCGLVT